MWALPGLDEIANIEEQLQIGGMWCLLLFQRNDTSVLKGLEKNWVAFNNAIGPKVHIITLLDINRRDDRVSLKYPTNYEACVGDFCYSLSVPLDELPALIILNSRNERYDGAPYWSLQRRSFKESSEALISLVSDLQKATSGSPSLDTISREEWLKQATNRLITSRSGRELRGWIGRNSGSVISLLKKLTGSLTGMGL